MNAPLSTQEQTELEQLRKASKDNFLNAHVVIEMTNKKGNFCRFLAVSKDRMWDDDLIGYAKKNGVKVIDLVKKDEDK